MSHTTHFDDCGCQSAALNALLDKQRADFAKQVDALEARIATLEAELAASRMDAEQGWREARMMVATANALRDSLENAAVTLRKNDLPHHAQVIVNILAQTPAASLAAAKDSLRSHDAEVLERGCAAMREVRIEHPPALEDDDQGPFLHPSDIENLTRAIKARALAAQEVKP